MIKLAIRKVKPDQEGHLRAWMAELNRRSGESQRMPSCCMNARQKTMPVNKAPKNVVCP
jgi:hypothetical protein